MSDNVFPLTTIRPGMRQDIDAVFERVANVSLRVHVRVDTHAVLVSASTRRDLAAQLQSQFADYRSLLLGKVIEAPPVLKTVLDGRTTVTPREDGISISVSH
jgi:hypothetical protein